jgi:hypothetical protein
MGRRGRALAEKYYNDKQCGKEVAEIIKCRVESVEFRDSLIVESKK